jgi:putative oxidoreductase
VLGTIVVNFATMARSGGLPSPLPGGQPLPGAEASSFYGACTLSLLLSGPGRLALTDGS